jgi:hypothetical protein
MISQTTLLLDQTAWDLVLDIYGNWALASAPYSIAQDVATAVKTTLGECWYDVSKGLPYQSEILGYLPPLALVKQQIVDIAMSVPNVASAEVVFVGVVNRVLTGQIQIIDVDNTLLEVGF